MEGATNIKRCQTARDYTGPDGIYARGQSFGGGRTIRIGHSITTSATRVLVFDKLSEFAVADRKLWDA